MASITTEVTCSGETHLLELRDDGSATMLDHDETMVRSFVEFGAEPPGCLTAIEVWREDPSEYLLYMAKLTDREVGLLACDWAEHVLHIFEKDYPDGRRPRTAIETARAFWHGTASQHEAQDTAKAATNAARAIARLGDKRTATEAAARAAAWSAGVVVREAHRERRLAAHRALRSAWVAAARATWGQKPEAARTEAVMTKAKEAGASERRWQIRHAIKMLATLEEDAAWPGLE
jgi:hypothetical protein